MKVKLFSGEPLKERAHYNLNDEKWKDFDELLRFVKLLLRADRCLLAEFEFSGSVYSVSVAHVENWYYQVKEQIGKQQL